MREVDMRLLNDEEQKQFRAEYQQLENEVQKNIAVYFSALVVAAGWIFGPQSKPIIQIFLGNEGTNIFGLLILLGVNVIFTSFLTYKSIRIQEIMQFVAYLSPSDCGIQYWESWRRSPQSLTKKAFARQHHMATIILVPFWVSIFLLWGTHHLIWTNPRDLAKELQRFERDGVIATDPSAPIASSSTAATVPALVPPSKDSIERIGYRLGIAKRWWWAALVFHYIPVIFFAVSWPVANKKWSEIQKLKTMPDFKNLVQIQESESSEIRSAYE